jgi:hypothetical protein
MRFTKPFGAVHACPGVDAFKFYSHGSALWPTILNLPNELSIRGNQNQFPVLSLFVFLIFWAQQWEIER